MPTVSSYGHRKRWEERSVVVALVLAILVPGLGHLFQGRVVKAFIYFFGILGLFIWGVKLGEGIVVYNLPDRGAPRRITLHYAAQLGAGAIAYPALWQQKRMLQENNRPASQLDQPLRAPFSGRLTSADEDAQGGQLQGTVDFKPEPGENTSETKGTFTGTLDGKPITLSLSGNFFLDKPIAAGFNRRLRCGVVGETEGGPPAGRMIVGSIPRPIMDGYGITPELDQLTEISGRLGKLHELALVFTWIAGLLNVLAIWDCVQGPAYGFGDEHWSEGPDDEPKNQNRAVPAASNSTVTSV